MPVHVKAESRSRPGIKAKVAADAAQQIRTDRVEPVRTRPTLARVAWLEQSDEFEAKLRAEDREKANARKAKPNANPRRHRTRAE